MFLISDFEKSLVYWHKAKKLREGSQEVIWSKTLRLQTTTDNFFIDILLQVKDAIENIGQTIVSSMEGCFRAQDTDTIIRVNVVNFCTIQMCAIFSRLWWMNMAQWITISKASEGARRWEFHNSNSVQRINCFCTYFRLCPTPTKTWPPLRYGWGRGRRRRSWLKLRTGTRKFSSGTCMQTKSFSGSLSILLWIEGFQQQTM